jgi:hypothetical protein
LVVTGCVAACSGSSGTATNTTKFIAADPGVALKQTLQVNAGGPYVAKSGLPITLRGSYSVADQADAGDRLAVIGRALQGYLAANGTYPPAALLNANGQATVSWRVLILPYLGEKALYAQFNLGKPWNDPANLPLLHSMPAVFQATGAAAGTTETGFAGVAGVGSLFEKSAGQLNGGLSVKAITRGATMHIAAGPVGSNVHLPWSAPGDIDFATATQLGAAGGFSGAGNAFTPLLFLDGTVRLIPDAINRAAMISWAKLSGPYCTCAPPNQLDTGLSAFWDLDGTGAYGTAGLNATFVPHQPGTYQVALRVIDRFGGQYDRTAMVEAR